MSTTDAPKIDPRTREELLRLLAKRLALPPAPSAPLGWALLGVFTRYCEILIERLNRVPEKNHLAFLQTLAISPVPPAAARVPITFEPVKGLPAPATRSPVGGQVPDARRSPALGHLTGGHRVPKHTKVAGRPAAGQADPVVFETEQDLILSSAKLQQILLYDPLRDESADRGDWASPDGGAPADAFAGGLPAEHGFFLVIARFGGKGG